MEEIKEQERKLKKKGKNNNNERTPITRECRKRKRGKKLTQLCNRLKKKTQTTNRKQRRARTEAKEALNAILIAFIHKKKI